MKITQITYQSLLDDNQKELALTYLAGDIEHQHLFDELVLRDAQSAADLVGHLNFIHPKRIQVVGRAELEYYQRSIQDQEKRWQEFISYNPPCIIIADHLSCPECLSFLCQQKQIMLLSSPKPSAAVIDHLRAYLSNLVAPKVMMHGVFMDIFGLGVLITGESGLGKSELGLELITRGHGLVADDAIEFSCLGKDFIEGRCPPLLQNLLEVRGLGLLDIRSIFGETAVRRKMKLKLLVKMMPRNDTNFERLPIEQQYHKILGQNVRLVQLQIAEGRNMAVIVEAAVRNTILQMRGIDTLKEFMHKQQQAILWEDE